MSIRGYVTMQVCNIQGGYNDGPPSEKPIVWITEMITTMAFREETKKPLPMPQLKAIRCTTGMCVFEKCAAHENGKDGQDCGVL